MKLIKSIYFSSSSNSVVSSDGLYFSSSAINSPIEEYLSALFLFRHFIIISSTGLAFALILNGWVGSVLSIELYICEISPSKGNLPVRSS